MPLALILPFTALGVEVEVGGVEVAPFVGGLDVALTPAFALTKILTATLASSTRSWANLKRSSSFLVSLARTIRIRSEARSSGKRKSPGFALSAAAAAAVARELPRRITTAASAMALRFAKISKRGKL